LYSLFTLSIMLDFDVLLLALCFPRLLLFLDREEVVEVVREEYCEHRRLVRRLSLYFAAVSAA
jgi:hypothetical protein